MIDLLNLPTINFVLVISLINMVSSTCVTIISWSVVQHEMTTNSYPIIKLTFLQISSFCEKNNNSICIESRRKCAKRVH